MVVQRLSVEKSVSPRRIVGTWTEVSWLMTAWCREGRKTWQGSFIWSMWEDILIILWVRQLFYRTHAASGYSLVNNTVFLLPFWYLKPLCCGNFASCHDNGATTSDLFSPWTLTCTSDLLLGVHMVVSKSPQVAANFHPRFYKPWGTVLHLDFTAQRQGNPWVQIPKAINESTNNQVPHDPLLWNFK